MKTHTVFCQHVDGTGTVHIAPVNAIHIEKAKNKALVACADDWNYPVDHVRVLGVAEGVVKIIEWNDPE